MTNNNYGKMTERGTLEYAPRMFIEGTKVVVPRIDDDAAYASRGWYKIVDEEPDYDPSLKHPVRSGWTVDDEMMTLTATYNLVDNLPERKYKEVKKYSKLKMTLFLIDKQIWPSVKTYLEEIGYYDLFVMAQYFLENDPYFVRGVQMFKTQFAEQIEDMDTTIQQMLQYAEDGFETVLDDEEQTNA